MRRAMMPRFGIFLAECLLFLAVTAIMLICAEVFLRWYYRDVLSSSSGVDYFYNRSYHKFAKEKNALRLRGKQFSPKSNHAARVVVMGDSFTYGQGVYPYTLRFPEQAAVLFSKKYPDLDVEFVSVGTCGADLPNYNKNIVNFVTKLHPDFVLYQWFINDMDMHHDFAHAPHVIANQKLHHFLTENSVLYFVLQRGWKQLRTMFGHEQTYHEYLVAKFADPGSQDSLAAQKELNRLLDQLAGKNIPHGIVLFPDASSRQTEYKLGFMHEQVLNVCRERHIQCLDLREAYRKYDDDIQQLWANVFDHHPSALAHRVAAENIADFFGETWKKMALRSHSPYDKKG